MLSLLLALAAQAEEGVPIRVRYEDGLRFSSADGRIEARLGGQVVTQARATFGRPDDDTPPLRTVPNSAYLRYARIDVGLAVERTWNARLAVDVQTGLWGQSDGSPPSSTRTAVRDAYVEWAWRPELRIRAGQFRALVGQEENSSLFALEWIERTPMSRLMPGRDMGLEARGTLFDGALSYGLMAGNGGGLVNDQARSVSDGDDEKELAGGLIARPFSGSACPPLDALQVMLGGTIGSADDVPGDDFDLITPELSVLWLDSTGGRFDGRRRRLVPALAGAWGPVGLSGEAVFREDAFEGPSGTRILRSRGWMAGASVMLNGGSKRPGAAPVEPWSAELAIRAARAEVPEALDTGLASDGNARRVDSFTVGLHAWPSRHLRLSMDVVHERYRDALDADTRRVDDLTGLLARVHVVF